ncbi:GtrA family protein [Corynebacterium hindlerae]|uniref:GtrA family protein n=1 Tax=Corynebacterium hindlerae TaxID=699041 RepID=UPI001E3E8338|nr:GtrA family protein [Corynebacterium hindlerae]
MLSERLRTNTRQFIKFGIVGGSGVPVNLLVAYLALKISVFSGGPDYHEAVLGIPGTPFNIRGFHVFQAIAFLVANMWNYQLNRTWTFGGLEKRSWLRGFFPFLTTGLLALLVQMAVSTLMLNPTSPLALPDFLDDSSGLKNRFYWAQAISILVAMPVNFIINKLWAFRTKKPTHVVIEADPR